MTASAPDPGLGIDIRGLAVGYPAHPVLANATMTVGSLQVAAVLGPSGSGKTTLLRAVAGFVTPVAGSITLGDQLVFGPGVNVPPERRSIGLVPQEGALFPHLDVAGNIGFGLPRRTRAQRARWQTRVDELADLVSLGNRLHVRPHELSGGMQQRVAVARALAHSPQTVLLDEPFSALDAGLRRELRLQVRDVLLRSGATVILVTHDEDEARAMADAIWSISGAESPHSLAEERGSQPLTDAE